MIDGGQSRTGPGPVKVIFMRGDGQASRQVLVMAGGPALALLDAMPGSSMLRSFEKRPEHLQALDRVKAWTRARFKLAEDVPVLVSEVACGLPGCPPLETVIAFWTQTDTRHHFKVFKRLEEVVADDLPPTWMKNALIALDGDGLECC
jgi:hypothetical protein